MVEQWSSKSPMWVRFLLLLLKIFKKNFLKKISTKPNQQIFYLFQFKNSIAEKTSDITKVSFIFKKSMIKRFFLKKKLDYFNNTLFIFLNILFNKNGLFLIKNYLTGALFLNLSTLLINNKKKFSILSMLYDYNYINNDFIFYEFYITTNKKKLNKNFLYGQSFIESTAPDHFSINNKIKNKATATTFTINYTFKNLSLFFKNSFNLIFLIPKLVFNSSMFNKAYFKKIQTNAFMMDSFNIFSLDLLRLFKSSPHLTHFEFFKFQKNFKTSHNLTILKKILMFNFYNTSDNIFFSKL